MIGFEVQDFSWEFDVENVIQRCGARLPHWTAGGATYSVTFRLADSLPQVVLKQFLRARDEILIRARAGGRTLSLAEQDRLRELHAEKIEGYLDAGVGACLLRKPAVARVVCGALAYFEGTRYETAAWCVMPNHVHVVTRPRNGFELPGILHSWKSFSAKQIHKLLGTSGPLWQVEYYDRLIRDAEEFRAACRYVVENPSKAGLLDWPWVGLGALVGLDGGQDEGVE